MTFTAGFANQAKLDYLTTLSTHNLWIALYLQANANFTLSSTAYSATGEISGAGYTAGGLLLTGATVGHIGDTYYLTFADASWAGAVFTADACLIYDASNSNHIEGFYTFTSITKTGSTFTLTMNPGGVIQAI